MPQHRNQQQTATQVLLHCHKHDEFCINYSGCGRLGVTGDSLTLQRKDPSADRTYGGLFIQLCTAALRLIVRSWFMFQLLPPGVSTRVTM
jgi:hypothetical protein